MNETNFFHCNFSNMKTADNLKKDVLHIEMSITEKKKQLEKLVQEMKEVNLQSLTVATDDQPIIEGNFVLWNKYRFKVKLMNSNFRIG